MGIYWPLEEQMLAAGGEVLLERLPAAGRGSSGQREWRLAERGKGGSVVRDIWRESFFHEVGGAFWEGEFLESLGRHS